MLICFTNLEGSFEYSSFRTIKMVVTDCQKPGYNINALRLTAYVIRKQISYNVCTLHVIHVNVSRVTILNNKIQTKTVL